MAKYRKRPVIVEAEEYREGLEDGFDKVCGYEEYLGWRGDSLIVKVPYISTLEGKLYITKGDYIIVGVAHEKYPCKPDIFHKTYEEVYDASQDFTAPKVGCTFDE